MSQAGQKSPVIRLAYAREGVEQLCESAKPEIIIGRGAVDVDLSPLMEVSRHHVRIQLVDGKYRVEDLKSVWGTKLNGLEIKGQGAQPLKSGDILTVGKTELRVTIPSPQAPPASYDPFETRDTQPVEVYATVDAKAPANFSIPGQASDTSRRLSSLFELPLKLATEPRLENVLQILVRELVQLIPKATRSALVLADRHDGGLILKAWFPEEEPGFSTTLAKRAMAQRQGLIWRHGQGDIATTMRDYNKGAGMYAPLLWREAVLGVICVNTPQPNQSFNQEDLRMLLAMAHYGAMALANHQAQDDVRRHSELMDRMISCRFPPQVRQKLMREAVTGALAVGTRQSHLTVLVSDIRGFTQLTAQVGAQRMNDLLNELFPLLIEPIHENNGTIERFVGDAIFAVFGSPEPDDHQHEHAVRAALEMQKVANEMMRFRAGRHLETCEIGIGIDCGEALHGFIGNAKRLEYAVVGTPANFAARFSNGAGRGEVLISPEVYGRVFNKFRCERAKIQTKHEGEFQAFRVSPMA
jgi:adenylate cyclase